MQPNLNHPVPILVEQLDRAGTPMDDDFREPARQASRLPRVTCPGQVHWTFKDDERTSLIGAELGADGYILFRFLDLRAVGIAALHRGDRFLAIGNGVNKQDIDVYIVALRPTGHYGDQGGATMIKAFFKDRSPAHQSPGGV